MPVMSASCRCVMPRCVRSATIRDPRERFSCALSIHRAYGRYDGRVLSIESILVVSVIGVAMVFKLPSSHCRIQGAGTVTKELLAVQPLSWSGGVGQRGVAFHS